MQKWDEAAKNASYGRFEFKKYEFLFTIPEDIKKLHVNMGNLCNYRCVFCYQKTHAGKELSEETGLGTFGSTNIRMSVCTENALASSIEFSAFATAFRITDPNGYIFKGKRDLSLAHMNWLTIEAMKPV